MKLLTIIITLLFTNITFATEKYDLTISEYLQTKADNVYGLNFKNSQKEKELLNSLDKKTLLLPTKGTITKLIDKGLINSYADARTYSIKNTLIGKYIYSSQFIGADDLTYSFLNSNEIVVFNDNYEYYFTDTLEILIKNERYLLNDIIYLTDGIIMLYEGN